MPSRPPPDVSGGDRARLRGLSGRYRLVVRCVTPSRPRCERAAGSSGLLFVYGGEAGELDA